jgi:anti-repressor protein
MNLPAVFNFHESPVRIILQPNGEPLFNANDVSGLLGYSNARDAVAKHCRPKGVAKCDTPTAGGIQALTFLSEGNLFRLVLRSDKPEADEFQDWVTDEVLPQIRKTGGYAPAPTLPQTKSEALRQLADSIEREEQLQLQVAAMQPAADFYAQVADSKDGIPIASASSVLNMPGVGEIKLFAFLREQRILQSSQSAWNVPYREYIERGYFRVIEQKWQDGKGETRISTKTLVLQKGLDYIRKALTASS